VAVNDNSADVTSNQAVEPVQNGMFHSGQWHNVVKVENNWNVLHQWPTEEETLLCLLNVDDVWPPSPDHAAQRRK